MDWIFDNDSPIYIQLINQLKAKIILGVYKPGEKLPSVRDLALKSKVNPNTMQKALSELETYNLVYTQRTSGRFVTDDKKLLLKLKEDIINQKVEQFINDMKKIGINTYELSKYLDSYGKEE